MKQIFKYGIGLIKDTDNVTKILSTQEQNGEVKIWAEHDKNVKTPWYYSFVIGTGWDVEEKLFNQATFLNTVITKEGYVWHIYYVTRDSYKDILDFMWEFNIMGVRAFHESREEFITEFIDSLS